MNVRKIIFYAIGPIGAALLGFISLPLISWLFTPADVGRISLLLTIINLSTLLFSLGLDQSYVREYHDIDDKKSLFKTMFLPGLGVLLIVLSLTYFYDSKFLSNLLFNINDSNYSIIIIFCIIFSFFSRFLSLILRMEERALVFSVTRIITKLVIVLAVLFFMIFSHKENICFFDLLIAYFSAFFITLLTLLVLNKEIIMNFFVSKFDYEILKTSLKYGFPLILGGVAFWGLTAIDKIFLKNYSTLEEVGIYSVAVSFAGAASILQNVFSTIWAPTVYKWVSNKEDLSKVKNISELILFIVLVLYCFAGIFSWMVDYILPDKYIDVKYILLSCMGYPLLYTLSEVTAIGLGITKRSNYSMLVSIIGFVINIIGNYFLVPIYGASGAAVSTSLSFFIFFILRTEFSNLFWLKLPRAKMYSIIFITVVIASICTLYGQVIEFNISFIWLIWLFIIVLCFKKQIPSFLILLKNN
ncbi:polysaccharide biosynthesis protein [Photobacterium kishitanii]|uniref:lipopolysaccharide biosynthesis protein n=1 Tax=Photobacterium kishitanii TaxID=318456 RepID=UPI000D167104|nr:oligosaccharide flippase family protein [Photobacterium kishitanii]PSW60624.1 polysaccharide biosynthesis protein [Photobacterium kishitanii]